MLILQRRKGQALSINHNITLTVVDAGTDWVKLAIVWDSKPISPLIMWIESESS